MKYKVPQYRAKFVRDGAAERIDRTGLDVAVELHRCGHGGRDTITGADEEQREFIRAVVQDLWEAWCADGAPRTTGAS